MNGRDLLLVRGWREVSPGMWEAPPGAETGRPGGVPTDIAAIYACTDDMTTVHEHGSVTYRPTAEQAQLPLLAACAAQGMHERDVIAKLHERVRLLEAEVRDLRTYDREDLL